MGVSNEFRPGHPVIFWLAVIALTFGFFSIAKATATIDDCDQVTGGRKTWIVFPPKWECGDRGRIRLTE